MLINAKKILENNKSVFQFNILNLETARFVLEQAQKSNNDIIVGVSEGAVEYIGGYNVVYNMIKSLIDDLNISINVCLHLDHSKSFLNCKKAIDSGFNSVMIDASDFSLEDNIKYTREVVEYAKKYNVSVEGEIGVILKNSISKNHIDINDCIRYVEVTNVDLLAPYIGNVHGSKKNSVKLDFNLLKKLNEVIDVPLVLHGGSGVSLDDIVSCCKNGIKKININTNLQFEYSNAIRNFIIKNDTFDLRKIMLSGKNQLKNEVKKYLEIINNL